MGFDADYYALAKKARAGDAQAKKDKGRLVADARKAGGKDWKLAKAAIQKVNDKLDSER